MTVTSALPGNLMAFWDFKPAAGLEGIHARHLQHQTVGEGFDQEGLAVPALAARAHDVLDADATLGHGNKPARARLAPVRVPADPVPGGEGSTGTGGPAHVGPGPGARSRRALPLGFRLPSL